MEICAYPKFASLPPSSSSSSFSFGVSAEKVRKFCSSAVSAVISNLFYAILTFFFAVVGATLGAMTGALIGLKTRSGFVCEATVGAITGAVFLIEVFKTSLALWHSDDSGIGCFLSLIDNIESLLSGELVQKRFCPAMQSAVESQMGAVGRTFEEVPSNFETRCTKGLSSGSVDEKIPKIRITAMNVLDTSACSICLQDFQIGETGRSLPPCHHMFHLPCIDKWLLMHSSCPLCRRDL